MLTLSGSAQPVASMPWSKQKEWPHLYNLPQSFKSSVQPTQEAEVWSQNNCVLHTVYWTLHPMYDDKHTLKVKQHANAFALFIRRQPLPPIAPKLDGKQHQH